MVDGIVSGHIGGPSGEALLLTPAREVRLPDGRWMVMGSFVADDDKPFVMTATIEIQGTGSRSAFVVSFDEFSDPQDGRLATELTDVAEGLGFRAQRPHGRVLVIVGRDHASDGAARRIEAAGAIAGFDVVTVVGSDPDASTSAVDDLRSKLVGGGFSSVFTWTTQRDRWIYRVVKETGIEHSSVQGSDRNEAGADLLAKLRAYAAVDQPAHRESAPKSVSLIFAKIGEAPDHDILEPRDNPCSHNQAPKALKRAPKKFKGAQRVAPDGAELVAIRGCPKEDCNFVWAKYKLKR